MRSILSGLALIATLTLSAAAQEFRPDDPLYREIMKAEEAMFDARAFPMWPESSTDIENLTFDLLHCGSPAYMTDISSDQTEIGLESVAHWVTYWRRNLTAMGYPETVWQPIVETLEKNALLKLPEEWAADPDYGSSSLSITNYDALEPLVTALDRYRAEKDTRLPPVVADGACGDGFIDVPYELIPAEGTLFVLSEIRFHLCKVKGLDPLDRTACDRWEIASDNNMIYAAGRYRYMVEWSDGTSTHGTLPLIDDLPDEGEAITIRKSDG